jgi:hypothetical protein
MARQSVPGFTVEILFMRTLGRVLPAVWVCCVVSLWLFAPRLFAGGEENVETNKQLIFVPPPIEGVISLGVYDAHGKLVRVLKQAAEIDSFKPGLNGLFIDWDGLDANGKVLPAGKYFARGVLIGDVNISGVGYHLNDWVDDTQNLRVKMISSPALLGGRSLAVLADTGRPEILIVDAGSLKAQRFSINPGVTRLKSDGANLLAIYSDHIACITAADGTTAESHPAANIRDADRSGSNWVILTDREIQYKNEGQTTTIALPDPNINRCALLTTSLVVASPSGKLWRTESDHLVQVELDEPGELLDLSAGAADQIWLLIENGPKTWLRQVDLAARTSKDFDLPDGLPKIRQVSASRTNSDLLLYADLNPGQRVIGLHFQTVKDQQSVWEKWFDRSLVPHQFFDVLAGTVVRADSKTESAPLLVRPENNPLENTRQANFLLSAVADNQGVHLATNDGLPLLQISKTKAVDQVKWEPSGSAGMKVYLSDGTAVEEYSITGLQNLYRFDAGSF